MWKDPIVEEIRKYREEEARRLGYDPDRIVADIRERQKVNAHRLARLPIKEVSKESQGRRA